MKKFILLSLIILYSPVKTFAQSFELKGLEIYNPVYFNPAFTSTDKLIQTDLIAYDFKIHNGYWLNAMSSLANSNSSFGVSIAGSKYYRSYSSLGRDNSDENIYMRGNSVGLSYAYEHIFTENLKVSGGLRFTHSYANITDTTINLLSAQNGALIGGLKIEYRKLYAGICAGTGLYNRRKLLDDNDEIEFIRERIPTFNSTFFAGYSLGGERRLNFDPIVGFQYFKDFKSDYSDFGFYAGGNITLVKTIGLGFTVGDMFSLSTSISVLDRVSLMVGFFQREGDIHLVSQGYTLEFSPFSFIAQLRIKL